MVYRKLKRPSLKKKSVIRRRRAGTKSRRGLANMVKKIVRGQMETKRVGIVGEVTAFNCAASVIGDVYPVVPYLSAGSADQQRVGNTITLMKHQTKGTIKITNSGTIDYVTLWYVEDKWNRQCLDPLTMVAPAGDIYNVYKNQAQVPTNPIGDWIETGYLLNTERFRIKRKVFKMAQLPVTFQAAYDGNTTAIRQFSFTQTYKKGRKLKYQTEVDTLPNNFNCYMFVSYQRFDQSTSTVGTDVTLQATSFFSYKDA